MAYKVYIDQGHNPRDYNTGAEGNGFFEQDITYRIGLLLYDYLAADPNFIPRLSRPTQDTVLGTNNTSSLTARVNQANSWGADIFVSLHTNASAREAASGVECLIYDNNLTEANTLATYIAEQVSLVVGIRNRGVIERPGLYVLRRTEMPATIVEMGFITNANDVYLMTTSPNLFALGIYRGIQLFYGLL